MATCRVIGQESAEAILGAEVGIDGMAIGNEPGKAGKTHPAEGPNPK